MNGQSMRLSALINPAQWGIINPFNDLKREGNGHMKAAPAPQPLSTFGQCLKQLLAKRKLSASALSRMMEQKSRNGIFRILDDTSGPAAQTAFYDSLIASDCLSLTPEEKEALSRALEVSHVGAAGYMSNQAMHRLLGDVDLKNQPDEPFDIVRSSDGSRTTFEESMRRLARENRSVRFVMTGCCYRSIFKKIADAFEPEAGCKVSILHYMYTGGDDIIRFVSAIQPVFYSPSYEGYCIQENLFNTEREQIYRANTIIAHCVGRRGGKSSYLVSLIDPRRMLVVDPCNENYVALLERMMREDQPRMHRLKAAFALNYTPGDYLAYTEAFRKLESGRAIYDIKLDVPMNYIHPDLLLSSVRKGFPQQGFGEGDELQELIGKFYDIHFRRYENFMTKRRATHTIFSREAMMSFAKTGVQSDHFFAMAPYEKQERIQILEHLRQQNEENPYFNLYFFKPEYHPPRTEICLYEGKGTMLTKADTDFNLSNSHAETLVTQREFCQKYKEFYMKDLLVSKVLSAEETTAVFGELIEAAKGSEE